MAKPTPAAGRLKAVPRPEGGSAKPGGWVRYEHVYLAIGLGVGFLALWEFLSQRALIEPVLFPPPTKIAAGWWMLVTADYFPKHFWVTMMEIALGFLLGAGIGLLLGILLATVPWVRMTLYPSQAG